MDIIQLLMALNRGGLPPLPAPAPSEDIMVRPGATTAIPYAPVPGLGPLSEDTTAAFGALNPEPVPPRFTEPAAPDMNFVSQQTGAPPVAPAPLSRGQRIANALIGFGAGLQGRGGEFLEQLREPQREYQRQVERYEGRRTQAIEAAERRAEREADRANRAAELQYNRDYNLYLKKLGIRKDEADEQTQRAFEIYKLDRHEKAEAEKERQRERRAQESDARVRTGRFFTLSNDMTLSTELGRHYAGLSDKPLSAAAAKLDAKLQGVGEARMGRAMRVGVGGRTGGGVDKQTAKLIEEFNNARNNLITAIASGQTGEAQKQIRRKLDSLVRRLTGRPGVETGYGGKDKWPYVKVNGILQGVDEGQPTAQQPTALAQRKTIKRSEMQALGVTDAEAKAEGYAIIEGQ